MLFEGLPPAREEIPGAEEDPQNTLEKCSTDAQMAPDALVGQSEPSSSEAAVGPPSKAPAAVRNVKYVAPHLRSQGINDSNDHPQVRRRVRGSRSKLVPKLSVLRYIDEKLGSGEGVHWVLSHINKGFAGNFLLYSAAHFFWRSILQSSGAARVNNNRIVVLINDKIIRSSGTRYMGNPIAELLDTGNLVCREENGDHIVWQSFDYPRNIMLPGMEMGSNLGTGHERNYTSWESVDDPSPGRFLYRVDSSGFPWAVLCKASLLWTRTGPWIGCHSSGNPTYSPNGISTIHFTFNKEEIYYGIDLVNKSSSSITFFVLQPNGDSQFFMWNYQEKIGWFVLLTRK
ncbi:hypothetical protein POM88_035396 [Heracleum sosnowskyi]|uniref:Bulb-type lectin domain-containing protein n=1 Tax=Heracleum sosnowskyi TaxID=360622 RepID=A0AAD8ME36_9APIA|nr:hypothetical protein POM88_035396 [Heracleum sosnowskyi]